MGEVYLALDTHLERKVALKVLPAAVAADQDYLSRLLREARLASALNHPNIVTIYEVGEDGPVRFIVTEFIEGVTLRHIAPLPVRDAITVTLQVTSALRAAHAAGIIHRDLKPANIMRRPDGLIKVLDFGLAKRLTTVASGEEPPTTSILTDTDSVVGTVGYMSPEQIRNLQLDVRSDVFSLGVVLYELITGVRPFQGETTKDVMAAILMADPVPLGDIDPAAPAALDAILRRALAKNLHERYGSMAEFEAELRYLAQDLDAGVSLPFDGPVLAGRDAELAALWDAFRCARRGNGLLQCVSGEAGIGKTALVDTFLTQVTRERAVLARGSCSERLAGSEAYLPVLEALDGLLRQPHGAALAAYMKSQASSWYVQVAPQPADDPSFPLLLAQLRTSSAERLKREMAGLLQYMSTGAPLVLFLEDLHWSDESTVDLLAYLGTRIHSMHVLIVVTLRPSEMHRTRHPFLSVKLDLQSRRICRDLALGTLDRQHVYDYVDRKFPGHQFPNEFLSLIHEKTEGYPLFFVDLFRYLTQRELVARGHDVWQLSESVENLARDLPESVRSMVERKVSQLDEDVRRLLATASVQGRTFRARFVAQALDLDESTVEEQLASIARRSAIVDIVGEEELPGGIVTLSCRFAHVLYQNAIYDTLAPSRRAALSKSTAEMLVAALGETANLAPTLAVLLENGREYRHSAEQFAAAARAATEIFAYTEALALARRGLAALEHVAPGMERSRVELVLQIALIRPSKALFGFASRDVMDTYERVRELSEQVGAEREAFFVLSGLCIAQLNRGELSSALAVAEQCSAIANKTGDPVLLAQVGWQRGALLQYMGRFVEAREQLETGLRVYDPAIHHGALTIFGLGDGPAVSIAVLAQVWWYLGYPNRSQQTFSRALDVARQIDDPPATALILFMGIGLALSQRNGPLAAEYMARVNEIHLKHAFVNGVAAMLRAAVSSVGGVTPSLLASFQEAQAAYSTISRIGLTWYAGMQANLLARAGLFQEALTVVEQGLALADLTGERVIEAELWRLRGESLLGWRPADPSAAQEAEQSFARAIAVARDQAAKSWELRATASRTRLLIRLGRADEGRAELQQILEWFTEGLETQDYLGAKALMT